uniref:Uncharacterized protein n=1 Tax=Nelumbo nucifera TaxID=4432 RepID=A0A822Z965_NELNU|nr:TPA_asm: hypothetical protein HUJ06_014318 [Nelumbo nucifera]
MVTTRSNVVDDRVDLLEEHLHQIDGYVKEMKEIITTFISQFERTTSRANREGEQEGSSGDSHCPHGIPSGRAIKINFPIFSGDDPVP